jgi:O-antigen biosynthesis protein
LACSSNEGALPDAPHENSSETAPAGAAPGLTCSVVVCTRDRPEALKKCLQAASRLDYPHFDLVVVDSASKDSRAEEIAQRFGARYLREPKPGLSRARNCGAMACQTDIVAYLDDDSIPEADWLGHLAPEFADSQVMAVAGRTVPLSLETEEKRVRASMGSIGAKRPRLVVDRQTPCWFEMANFGGIGDGGNMAFRRAAFDVWLGFDERLGRGAPMLVGEEHDAFFSLLDRGYRVVYTPESVVQHPYPRTLAELRTRRFETLCGATGYLTLLVIEQARYRRATLKYMLEAVKGTPRAWRYDIERPRPRVIPRWRVAFAMIAGPILYLWASVTRGAQRR